MLKGLKIHNVAQTSDSATERSWIISVLIIIFLRSASIIPNEINFFFLFKKEEVLATSVIGEQWNLRTISVIAEKWKEILILKK